MRSKYNAYVFRKIYNILTNIYNKFIMLNKNFVFFKRIQTNHVEKKNAFESRKKIMITIEKNDVIQRESKFLNMSVHQ